MRRKLIASCLLSLAVLPAQALTKLEDSVGIIMLEDADPAAEKRYFKKWREIVLAPQTIAKLNQYTQKLERDSNQTQTYRVAFLMLNKKRSGEVVLGAAAFYGNWGSVVMKGFNANDDYNTCNLAFDGSGGFAGILGKPCRNESGSPPWAIK